MTLNFERKLSLENVREFLFSLMNPEKTKKIPRTIRQKAYYLSKHYPTPTEINDLSQRCPDILGTKWKDSIKRPKRFHVQYVEDAKQKIKSFHTKDEAKTFIKNFKVIDPSGYWIDMLFEGKILRKYP